MCDFVFMCAERDDSANRGERRVRFLFSPPRVDHFVHRALITLLHIGGLLQFWIACSETIFEIQMDDVGSSQLIWNLVVFFDKSASDIQKSCWAFNISSSLSDMYQLSSRSMPEGCRLSCLACSSIFWQIEYFDDVYWGCLGGNVARFISPEAYGRYGKAVVRQVVVVGGGWRVASGVAAELADEIPIYLLFY